jgi:hypothetical protein
MTSLVLGDLIQESLTPSVNAPLAIFRPSGCLGKNTSGRNHLDAWGGGAWEHTCKDLTHKNPRVGA